MYSIKDIYSNIESQFEPFGNLKARFSTFDSIYDAKELSLCWLRATGGAGIAAIATSRAAVIICEVMTVPKEILGEKLLIQVAQPQVAFMRLLKNLVPPSRPEPGIHSFAIVSSKAEIGPDVHIGPFCVVGPCRIGTGTIIKSHAVIHHGAVIGTNCLISEHCNISGEGFGYIRNEQGQLENMLHIGQTIIEDEVHIFPYTNVDRGTLGTTFVGAGSKIDHFCHIGHNSRIGSNTVITANVTTMGGAQIGSNCWIGCGTLVRDAATIGDGVVVGMGSVITKDIPAGQTWTGVPARELGQFKEMQRKLGML